MKNCDTMKPHLAKKSNCTGCMVCVNACKYKALKGYFTHDGHRYVKCEDTKCISCGVCAKKCPIKNGYNYEAKERVSEPYAAWNMNDVQRMKSSSGGIFSAIAEYVISQNGVVVGASLDAFLIKHIIIDKLDDLPALQGSKYHQSDLSGIYNLILNHLKIGRLVFFSGTGCQVGGLYSFLEKKIDFNLLITADLICHGVSSYLPLNLLLKNCKIPLNKIVSYRDKSTGWKSEGYRFALKLEDDTGKIFDFGNNNIVLSAFGSHLVARRSCGNCQFAFAKRSADFTLGDLWGDKDFPKQHYKGISVVVAHSDKAKRLLVKTNAEIRSIKWEQFLHKNPRMVCGEYNLKWLNIIPRFIILLLFRLENSRKIHNISFFYTFFKLYSKLYLGFERRIMCRRRRKKIESITKCQK